MNARTSIADPHAHAARPAIGGIATAGALALSGCSADEAFDRLVLRMSIVMIVASAGTAIGGLVAAFSRARVAAIALGAMGFVVGIYGIGTGFWADLLSGRRDSPIVLAADVATSIAGVVGLAVLIAGLLMRPTRERSETPVERLGRGRRSRRVAPDREIA